MPVQQWQLVTKLIIPQYVVPTRSNPCAQPEPKVSSCQSPRCQHIFVDPDSPSNDYTLTYNCIASSDNSRTYNDGYHIQHHLNSRLHWSELPHQFMSALDAHDKHDGGCGLTLNPTI